MLVERYVLSVLKILIYIELNCSKYDFELPLSNDIY